MQALPGNLERGAGGCAFIALTIKAGVFIPPDNQALNGELT